MACEKEYQDFVEAGKEYERIEMALSSILPPVTEPLSQAEDITPKVLTQEMLDQWRDLKDELGPAHDDWLRKTQVYLDCKKGS